MDIRTKTAVKDGASILISALSVEQVDEFNAMLKALPPVDQIPADVKMQDHPYTAPTLHTICWSLNNVLEAKAEDAGKDLPAEKLWTPKRVTKKWDNVMICFLRDEIMALTGLKVVTKEIQDGSVGEESLAGAQTAS
jgi:hypothetical protein